MTYTDENLRKLQLLQLKILLEVDRVCKKHNIPYFLVGGTLIGAVRHQGFIPWDDDIDIGMLRENYDKFIQICASELSSDFFLQTKESDSYCAIPWAKLQLKGTKRLDASTASTKTQCGIDIDIFPYDNMPKYPVFQWIHSNICWMLRGLYVFKCGYTVLNRENSLKKKIGSGICKVLSFFLPKPVVSRMMDMHFQKYNRKNTGYVMNLSSAYSYQRECVKRDVIADVVELEFEGIMFPAPSKYHEYLTQVFGDYMQLPPEEKRIQHAIVELDFGKYA